jgi:hypothetical protein
LIQHRPRANKLELSELPIPEPRHLPCVAWMFKDLSEKSHSLSWFTYFDQYAGQRAEITNSKKETHKAEQIQFKKHQERHYMTAREVTDGIAQIEGSLIHSFNLLHQRTAQVCRQTNTRLDNITVASSNKENTRHRTRQHRLQDTEGHRTCEVVNPDTEATQWPGNYWPPRRRSTK